MVRSKRLLSFGLAAMVFAGAGAEAQAPTGPAAFTVEPIAERSIERLPEGPLHWRIETFPSVADAQTAGGPLSLAAEHAGKAWLFTLGPRESSTPNGRFVAEIGPVPVVEARRYLIRINRAGGPPGAMTPVHSHAGSEAFYVLAGQLSQRTEHGVQKVEAGQAMNGHGADMAMQLTSSGATDLDQLVLFLVDADRPFSSAASFE